MLGLGHGRVELAPHSERWHELFEDEASRLREAMGGVALAVEHVGSTAVCGLAAKPILDIAVAVEDLHDVGRCIAPLAALGYTYRGEYGIPGRAYFVKGEPRTHHLHVVRYEGDLWRDHLAFRDALRRDPEAVEQYARLKHELSSRHAADREAYTEGKAGFIRRVLRAAGNA